MHTSNRRAASVAAFFASALVLSACADGGNPSMVAPDASANSSRSAQAAVANPVADQYVVEFVPGSASPRDLAPQLARQVGGELLHTYQYAIRGMAIRLPSAAVDALRRNPNVQAVTQDAMAFLDATQSGATWGIDRLDQRALPLSTTYTYNVTGSGVQAYIIDSGIDINHPDFGGRAQAGVDYVNDGNLDCNGHGTHVAGTVGSNTYGVAKGVTLISARVFPCSGGASYTTVIAAVDWVTGRKLASPATPMVANMSLGGGYYAPVNTAVTNSASAGVVYAISAGNDSGADACTKSPASTPIALTVASSTSSDARSSFSNIGTCVDIFAPGSSIRSTLPNNTTGVYSGTSMAAPHVAGVAALVLDATPSATVAQVNAAIVDNATANVITSAGTGSPNRLLYSLIGAAPPRPEPPPSNVAPTANFNSSVNNLTASFTSTSSDSDGTIASYSWNFGDGGTSTAANPSRTYAAAGTYSVTLTVTDNGGATGTVTKSVTVTAPTATAVSRIALSLAVDKRGQGTLTANVYAASNATITGTFTYNSGTVNTTSGTVGRRGYATLKSSKRAVTNGAVFAVTLSGVTGITTCSLTVGSGTTANCQ